MADTDVLDLPYEFDRLLRQELSVEPSPAFAVRVRERVAEQHRTPWWRARWIPAIATAWTLASIAIAVTVPAIARWTSTPVPPGGPVVRVVSVQHPASDPVMSPQPQPSASPVSFTRRPASAEVRGRPEVIPEVIVDGRQRAALATLFRMMEQGRVSGDSFGATVPVSLEPIADHMGNITVLPVVVSAMPPGGVLHDNER